MRFVSYLAVAGLLSAGGAAADERAMPKIFPYETHVETLDNGLSVILVPMRSEGLVAYWTIVRTGSRDEYEEGRTGFAHFFEHMMFQGTEHYPQAAYNDLVTKMGANANAFTTDDLTAYHLAITAEDLETVMQLESDRFQRLSYTKPDFETEAGAVYGEYRKNRTNPFFTIYEAVHQTAFAEHTYGHTTMGYEQDIQAMPQLFDYSRAFFRRYYRPENIMLLIVGDVAVGPTMDRVRRHYGDWARGYVAPTIPVEPEQRQENRIEVAYDGQSLPILWLAYKIDRFDPTDRNFVAASLLAELAFGETSELHKKLVLDQQVVEFISGDVGINRDPGLFDIYTRVKDPARVEEVLGEIDRTIASFRDRPPPPARLADLKSRLRYGFLMNLDTPDRVASALSRLLAIEGNVGVIDQLYATYETITPEDVQAAAQRYMVPTRRTVAVLRAKP